MKRLLILLSLLLIYTLPFTYAGAVSISPASFNEHFEENFEKTFTFRAGGTERVRLFLGGELREYATLDETNFEQTGQFSVTLKLPKTLERPGVNTLYVGVIESKEELKSGTVGGVAAIQAPIRVFVPYPGKYLDSKFQTLSINEGERASYILGLNNLGTENLNIAVTLDVYSQEDPDTLLIHDILEPFYIQTKSSEELRGLFNTTAFVPGDYIAYATLNYGKVTYLNSSFSIGKQYVEITDYNYLFKPNTINPFEVVVQSKWNSEMNHVYADITLTYEGMVVETIKTPSELLQPWEEKTLKGYFDATNLSAGRYLANIVVHYGEGKTTHKLVAVYLNDPVIEEVEEPLDMKLVVVTIVAGISLVWIIYLLVRITLLKRRTNHGAQKKI